MRILQQDNIAAHYRSAIYQLMDRELACDFCFGDQWDQIKTMDYSLLSHRVIQVWNRFLPGGLYYQKGFSRLLRSDYDCFIVLGDVKCLSIWWFCIWMRLLHPGKKVFFWSHGWYGKENALRRLIKKVFFRLPNGGVFLYGNRARMLMIEEGFNPDRLFVIYNSLDYDAQLPIRQSLQPEPIYQNHFGNTDKNLVFIGRLTPVKRLDLLLDAVAHLRNRGERVNVTFVGDGPERPNLERMVEVKGIQGQVWFYGASYDEQTNAELLFNADLCVSPGNIGLTAIHVMMFGCPAVTNDDFCHQMPEFEAIRDGETGTFFKANDSLSLADAVSDWFKIHGEDRAKVQHACFAEIDVRWNPHVQVQVLKEHVGYHRCRVIQLPKIVDPRGNLSIIEQFRQIPFEIRRAHWIYDVPGGIDRCGHAFMENEEFIVALSGSFDVEVDDGFEKKKFSLNRSYFGLFVPKGIWRRMTNFSTNSLALVLSSTAYNEADYVSDYQEYLAWRRDSRKVPQIHDAKTSVRMTAPLSGHMPSEGENVNDCSLCELTKMHDPEGNLTYIYENVHVPFPINRVFYSYDIPGGEDRGAHAHKQCHQFIIAASGSFEVVLDDGTDKRTVVLNRPFRGLHVPPGIWASEQSFSSGSICLVLASQAYDEADYIRSYEEYLQYMDNKKS